MKNINYLKKIRFHLLVILVLLLNISCLNSQALFQENIKDWFIKGDANWNFSNNELIGKIKNGAGFVMTQQKYKDFILELEFKPDSTINSGIFIRCKNNDISPTDCYEVNIWDLHPNQDYRTGAIVMKSIPLAMVQTIDKWNTYKIKNEKDHIQVWVNGILTADIRDKVLTEGYIGLQATGTGEIRFRNVKIKTLKMD
ncbi:3-keto-disaccharide hydrolase [Maribacter arcticus]|uniref:3-keto-alpha-glucoside-1,2-lyase/3-keto-2-hydroxy-glucal hydratase domain-containing protein n=1 Tax=Maribacter arcticus TaxID=561365 RepID=A0A1T4ZQX3_9FLAO|nr:DUF1080 domain-containing protein [Maribacter arcticus]SKB24957.1 protein of unknown function [Maribacter arcticus]|tara:strand:+ start:205 stop:798 length:594 start_codon:yes stop_codon:yes gene_type:complete